MVQTNKQLEAPHRNARWFDDDTDQRHDFQIEPQTINYSPVDLKISTLFKMIEQGQLHLIDYQRRYQWDIQQASKWIESLIFGLPLPPVFLYEETHNKFLIIKGLQRLTTIYYFIKQRFPRSEKQAELRAIFDQHALIPNDILHDNRYFKPFNLVLPQKLTDRQNRLKGANYQTLADYQQQLNERTIRHTIIKLNPSQRDDSAIYELFVRLKFGGVNIRPQEIRSTLYHSDFYNMLYRLNTLAEWRRLLNQIEPDANYKDIEILLRGFAMLLDGDHYVMPMTHFLNRFSQKCQSHAPHENEYLETLFKSFLTACRDLPSTIFSNPETRRFNIALYEAIFTIACEKPFQQNQRLQNKLDIEKINRLANDMEFLTASQRASTQITDVMIRLNRAREIMHFH